MLSLDELLGLMRAYKPNLDEGLLSRAYNYAMEKHKNQTRAAGESYFTHPLAVSEILINLRLDESTIVAALLHDTIEDTTATKAEIAELFGLEVADLVDGLTKLSKLDLMYKKAIQAENLRKLLLAITNDIRVLLIKLADRLHNMRTLEVMRATKRKRISRETLEIYAPLASRMGMQDIKEELEDLSFKYLNEEVYETIRARLDYVSNENSSLLKVIGQELRELFKQNNISAEVSSRVKQPYAVFHKMEMKGQKFEELSDIFAFRIIVKDVLDCYKVLGIVHTKWRMVPGRFKDYISTPKQNDYRSIHTTIVSELGQRVELQIRTFYMHEVAEYGVAAYSNYKEGEAFSELCKENGVKVSAWLRRTLDLLSEGESPEEFLEHTRLELYQDQVFCFTPKGELINLPRGATVLDFAYAVHSSIGDRCVGSRINGRRASISAHLQNGDEVEIICDDEAKPHIAYEKFVKTGRAKLCIRKATRAAAIKKYCSIGQQKLEYYFNRYDRVFLIKDLANIVKKFSYNNVESLLASVGRNETRCEDIFVALYPEFVMLESEIKNPSLFSLKKAYRSLPKFAKPLLAKKAIKRRHKINHKLYIKNKDFPVLGIDEDIDVVFAGAGAVPGDKIVGLLDEAQKSMYVYPIQSKVTQQYAPSSLVDLVWAEDLPKSRYRCQIAIFTQNQPGTLNKIIDIIANNDVNISDISISEEDLHFGKLLFVIEVWHLEQLNLVVSRIRDLDVVSKIYRLYD